MAQQPLTYSGGHLDRASARRTEAGWVAEELARPDARVIPMWQDRSLIGGFGAVPSAPRALVLDAAVAAPFIAAATQVVFLGLDGDTPYFAADVSALSERDVAGLAGGGRLLDLRRVVGSLSGREAALLAYARGVLHWNRHHCFCPACGTAAESKNGGHARLCRNTACGRMIFPRLEPAVIMLVEHAATIHTPRRCLLGLHKNAATAAYSTLAGFVEIGESLEDAVRREVQEETGVTVEGVTYVASQAWPFPSGIMVGFRAEASSLAIKVDEAELLEARWISGAELQAMIDACEPERPFYRPDSIERVLIEGWLRDRT